MDNLPHPIIQLVIDPAAPGYNGTLYALDELGNIFQRVGGAWREVESPIDQWIRITSTPTKE